MKRGRIIRMDNWDAPARKPRLKGGGVSLCDLTPRPAMHRLGGMIYFSQFRRSRQGIPLSGIKGNDEHVALFADTACSFLSSLVHDLTGWAMVTTPRRRHFEGFHFATAVCERMSWRLGIPFYDGAVQCVNRSRLSPQFHLLREIPERKVIVYDDIVTTGMTLTTTAALFSDREMVLCIVGVSNR